MNWTLQAPLLLVEAVRVAMLVVNVQVAIVPLFTVKLMLSLPFVPRALTAIVLEPLLVVLVELPLVVVVVVVVELLPQVKLADPEPTQCE